VDTALLYAAAAALVGIGVLMGLAHATEPARIEISQAPQYADRTVVLEANVVALEPLSGGSLRATLADSNHSIAAFLRELVPLEPGDAVRVTGRVAKYHGMWEIVVEDADDVELRVPWREGHVPLAVLSEAPWTHLDQNVRTSGHLEDRSRPPLHLEDPATGARFRTAGLDAGQWPADVRLDVHGTVEYDAGDGQFRLRVLTSAPWVG
jgi:hypothetical protein